MDFINSKSKNNFPAIEKLLPHTGDKILIDGVTAKSEGKIEAYTTHRNARVFASSSGDLPAWLTLEYMAQAISAYAGINSLAANQPISIGLLLGARKLESNQSHFSADIPLYIIATLSFGDDESISVFNCQAFQCSDINNPQPFKNGFSCQADLKVLKTDDPAMLLREEVLN